MSARSFGCPRWGARLASVLLAFTIAACLWGPAFAADGDPEPVRLVGKVKALLEGDAGPIGFELTAKGGPFRVEVGTATAFALAEGRSLVQCDRQDARLLAKHIPEQVNPENGQPIPAAYTQILAIVTGEPYAAPSDTSSIPSGVAWHEGKFGDNMKQKGLWVGEIRMMTGQERQVWKFSAKALADVKKGAVLFLEGEAVKEGKVKVVRPTRVVILAPTAPTAEIALVLGPVK